MRRAPCAALLWLCLISCSCWLLLAGINGQQEQQANGTLLQSSNQQQQQQHPRTPPSARSGSRLGLAQDQQQRQATPQQQPASHTMLLDVEQHPGVKTLLALVQADRFCSKEAAAVWSDGQTAATILEVSTRIKWAAIFSRRCAWCLRHVHGVVSPRCYPCAGRCASCYTCAI